MTCSPLLFTDILHDLSGEAIDNFPSFTGNNAVTASDHLTNFVFGMVKFHGYAYDEHEDVKIRPFFLSLEDDAQEWFWDFRDETFDLLRSIFEAFENKYGNQRGSPCASRTKKINEISHMNDPNIIKRYQ